MPIEIVHGDIVERHVDAVVNAANSKLRMGEGVSASIYQAAGMPELTAACAKAGFCFAGDAVVTPGFKLAPYIIHAVGPVWQGGGQGECEKLVSAYTKSLELADERECSSIAFPLIATGVYGTPKDVSLDCAWLAFENFPNKRDMRIELVLFGDDPALADVRDMDSLESYLRRQGIDVHAETSCGTPRHEEPSKTKKRAGLVHRLLRK